MNKYKKINNFDKLLDYFGSIECLAKKLGITKFAVYQWDHIPEKRAYQIELITKGKFSAKQFFFQK